MGAARVLIEGWRASKRPALKAVAGGPLSGVLPASMLDIVLEPPPFSAQGLLMGSGGLIALDERTCMVDLTRFMNIFNQDESCARCTTCRIGNMRIVDITGRITTGKGKPEDTEHLRFLDTLLRNGNCLHGQFSGYMLSALSSTGGSRPISASSFAAGFCPSSCMRVNPPAPEWPGAATPAPLAPLRRARGFWIDQNECVRCGVCAVCPELHPRHQPGSCDERRQRCTCPLVRPNHSERSEESLPSRRGEMNMATIDPMRKRGPLPSSGGREARRASPPHRDIPGRAGGVLPQKELEG
jgi:ferredoxin